MRIEILGTGCAKCDQLQSDTQRVASELGLDCEIVKVSEIAEIIARGVMLTPALVLDGEVLCSGRLPDPEELKSMLARSQEG